ncbi:MAG: glycosyl hydrolase, partial [Bacteroidia bacterium]|nr:glycosyl hydrolase [Bacteroidia bacterium]
MKTAISFTFIFLVAGCAFSQKNKATPAPAKEAEKKSTLQTEGTYSAFKWRSIGPSVTSGRVGDIAVNPKNKSEYYVVGASSGVWKTENNGITFSPVFDSYGSYSIGCISIDPSNPNVVWVGTGENNNQRSVAYGDGLYKSEDAGKSWKKVGLEKSEHIGRISIDPTNGDIVYVAAYGPLWNAGGERGIYKTTDGGKTWKQALSISENTGCNDVLIDPNHTNIIYAAAHQRRRHEWTYISGGPESGIYKSTDAGTTWDKLSNGLPASETGRIGLAMSPVNSDLLYAIVEANGDDKGFYRSADRGASWEKRSEWATAGNYYQEIIPDPKNADKVFSLDTWAQVTTDGGKSFKGMGEKHKHVDNHALYIEPENTNHMLMGCDGGLYETYDAAKTWQFKTNLPFTQFYRVTTDNSLPFYNVYGGTQDNNSLGGPSRTISSSGIINTDWFVTVGGDGFKSLVDPTDPNIIYSEWQYGGLIRYDKKSGEVVDIKPQEKKDETANRWNWDAPLLISNFSNKRLYFASQRVYRSDDHGNTWKEISGDLSKGLDRNKIPVMGKIWSMDAVAKNQSTSFYGNITSLCESPKNENLIFAGTDDGLIQITSDNGGSWTKISSFAGVPDQSFVQNIVASQHNENIVYACFNNHRQGDFKPYLMKSNDKGKTWSNISNNLPARGSVYCITEDFVNPDLLFCGTEFGIYFTLDGGKSWMKFMNGLPLTSVREIAIQKRETDLVIATFGRGFYVMDDYSPLQKLKNEDFEKKATILPVKDGLVFNQSVPFGHKGKSFQGESFFQTDNPPIGATITWFLKDDYKTIKEKRKASEKEKAKNKQEIFYPSADSLRLEDREEAPYVLILITDIQDNTVRQLKQPAKKGLYRTVWDGRFDITSAVDFSTPDY